MYCAILTSASLSFLTSIKEIYFLNVTLSIVFTKEIQDSYFLNVVVLRKKMRPGYNLWAKKISESNIESSSIHGPISIFLTEITFYY